MTEKTARIKVSGIVQGVGFRPFIHKLALKYGVNGKVYNMTGSVVIDVSGKPGNLIRFRRAIQSQKPAAADISNIVMVYKKNGPVYNTFKIARSLISDEAKFISPDIAVCSECLDEFMDESDRRYGYPFVNCTNCGPRFTIINDTPYDRKNTTMSGFTMCIECAGEYKNINDRRYHAEPNGCPNCGPTAWLADKKGKSLSFSGSKVFDEARALLKKGKIIAVKGIGGFHLAVDASNFKAVERLKMRKLRSNKPFAVMVDSVETAGEIGVLNRYVKSLLTGSGAPIVLIKKKRNSIIAENTAPGLGQIGLFLPYAPLQRLLFDGGLHALIMTSANLSEEPIQYKNSGALKALAGIADYFILHDREIVMPADDSVIKPFGASSYIFIRRSRGYAPAPLYLKKKYRDVIGAGAHLKNTGCLISGNTAILTQYIGDLENYGAEKFYESTIERFTKFYGIKPRAIACDAHPDYSSTRFAGYLAEKNRAALFKVQHHYAHMLSVMAELGRFGKVIGVIFDGTGLGDDGHIWGGEFLTGNVKSFNRAGHFKYMKLPGGDRASKEAYRSAISVLSYFLKEDKILSIYKDYNAAGILRALKNDINSPLSSAVGRLFDAAASILGICHTSTYDAEAPMLLEAGARGLEADKKYPFEIKKIGGCYEVDTMPLFEKMWRDRKNKYASANFHEAIATAALHTVRKISDDTLIKDVVLSGGVFQNTVLLEMLLNKLNKSGFNVLINKNLPPNDGSIALGQALYAAERIKQI
jgi:hydrogenase maturation protein HypF